MFIGLSRRPDMSRQLAFVVWTLIAMKEIVSPAFIPGFFSLIVSPDIWVQSSTVSPGAWHWPTS